MRLTVSFILGALLILSGGCGGGAYQAEIETVDSLKSALTKVEKDLLGNDTQRVSQISKEIYDNLRKLKRVYQPDTISQDYMTLITMYKESRNEGMHFYQVRVRLRQNIPYSHKQLDNLRHDLKEETISLDDAKKFVASEREAINNLIESYKKMVHFKKELEESYEKYNPGILQLLELCQADTLTTE